MIIQLFHCLMFQFIMMLGCVLSSSWRAHSADAAMDPFTYYPLHYGLFVSAPFVFVSDAIGVGAPDIALD